MAQRGEGRIGASSEGSSRNTEAISNGSLAVARLRLPIALRQSLSDGVTLALFTDVVRRLGPENIVSLMAAKIYGSTETTFYVAAVYFGSVGIKQIRHAIPAGLLADLTGVVASVIICRAVL